MISSVIGSPQVRVDLATQPYRGFADDHREAARPLQRNGKRAAGRLRYRRATPPIGTRPQLPDGTFALFSARSGQKALDRLGDNDQGPHSVFTRVLLERLSDSGSVVRVARAIREEVVELASSVRYQQTPTFLDQLAGAPVTL